VGGFISLVALGNAAVPWFLTFHVRSSLFDRLDGFASLISFWSIILLIRHCFQENLVLKFMYHFFHGS